MFIRPWQLHFALLFIATSAPGTVTPDGKALVYVGQNGESVTVLYLKPATDKKAVLAVADTHSELDAEPLLHSIRESGEKIDFVMKRDGKDYVTLYGRPGWKGSQQYELAVPGKADDIPLRLDKKRSADPQEILNRYLNRKSAPASYARNTESTKEDQRFKELASEASSACGKSLEVTIDWATFSDDVLKRTRVGEACGSALTALTRLCASQAGKTAVQEKIKSMTCRLGQKLGVEIAGGKLTWTTAAETPDQVGFAKDQIENKL